jgi:hypothetical protein
MLACIISVKGKFINQKYTDKGKLQSKYYKESLLKKMFL